MPLLFFCYLSYSSRDELSAMESGLEQPRVGEGSRVTGSRARSAVLAAVLMAALPAIASALGPEAKNPRIEDRIRGRRIAALSPPLENPAVRAVASATHMRAEDLVFGVSGVSSSS